MHQAEPLGVPAAPHSGTYLGNAPVDTAMETRVRMSGMRWPIATRCEDGKPLLGMGDYAVRSWTGWPHHMTLVILAHFFVVRMSLRLTKSPSSDVALVLRTAITPPVWRGAPWPKTSCSLPV